MMRSTPRQLASATTRDETGLDHQEAPVSTSGTHQYEKKPDPSSLESSRASAQACLNERIRRQLHLEAEDLKRNLQRFSLQRLPNPSLGLSFEDYESFALYLKSSNRITALLGAGLSASSGIPTFRGADRLWRGIPQRELASPYAFRDDPVLVWQFHNSRRHIALNAEPNRAHCALAELGKHKDLMAINQNIDGLSQRAGHDFAHIQPIHGSLFDIKCSNPDCSYLEYDNFKNPIVPALQLPGDADISDPNTPLPAVTIEQLPHCPRCAHLLRPAVVWYSEVLSGTALDRIDDWILAGKIDLMLVIGTRACVWPAADYIDFAREQGARVAIINMEDLDDDLESTQLNECDWFFKGDAATLVPEILKEVIGEVYGPGVTQARTSSNSSGLPF